MAATLAAVEWDIEEIDGTVINGDSEKKVHFSFWYRHRITPTDTADWGGAFWTTERTNRWVGAGVGFKARIHIQGRSEAMVLTTSWNMDVLSLCTSRRPLCRRC
jgi:hypothetical protein